MARQSFIDVEQVDRHVRIRAGQTTFHSEQYFDEATARRAAKGFVKAINERPMRLTLWRRGNKVTEVVRKVWATGGGKTVVIPADVSASAFSPAYFDPALETNGL